jgi:hypothetical protein
MYSSLPNLVLGFHGCDKELADKVISNNDNLIPSTNDYDWLGNGIYFWEFNCQRALDYAQFIKNNPSRCKQKIKNEAVIGAVIDLGHCLNLLDSESIEIVKQGYLMLKSFHEQTGIPLPLNKNTIDSEKDLLLRKLDCAVIEMIHAFNKKTDKRPYDSVRGLFPEGKELYDNAGFKEKSHIQICIINPNCIKGYFSPRKANENYLVP